MKSRTHKKCFKTCLPVSAWAAARICCTCRRVSSHWLSFFSTYSVSPSWIWVFHSSQPSFTTCVKTCWSGGIPTISPIIALIWSLVVELLIFKVMGKLPTIEKPKFVFDLTMTVLVAADAATDVLRCSDDIASTTRMRSNSKLDHGSNGRGGLQIKCNNPA